MINNTITKRKNLSKKSIKLSNKTKNKKLATFIIQAFYFLKEYYYSTPRSVSSLPYIFRQAYKDTDKGK